eukprot:COSAG01_NODE_1662_length_9555_cov_32.392718_3_plen_287_part_00
MAPKKHLDMSISRPSFTCSLAAGGVAGTVVDISLYPLDTIKTRCQSASGFSRAGGMRGMYRGVGTAVLGSFPASALFFATYEAATVSAGEYRSGPVAHMLAGSLAEAVACLIRVPTENVKQKLQAGLYPSALRCARGIASGSGGGGRGLAGFYSGYLATVMRSVPFSAIQFTLYERLKAAWSDRHGGGPVNMTAAALCGSVAGGVSGLVTTPLDVTKTRLMLGADASGVSYEQDRVLRTMHRIYADEGVGAFCSGVGPRVCWIAMGGAVFLGSYEAAKANLMQIGL